ncbi:MAG: hypothetical protein RBT71_07865 [Flavobacteriales bacterium]|jgi:hypothetical protein|nr:hypothetical protein [Flavobacteriales bacterium]
MDVPGDDTLRVAVRSDTPVVRQWHVGAVRALAAVPAVEVVSWLYDDDGPRRRTREAGGLLHRWWTARHAPAEWRTERVDPTEFRIVRAASTEVAALRPHLVLDLSHGAATLPFPAPELGVWRYVGGAGRRSGGLPGLWELLLRERVHVARLVHTGGDGLRTVLHEGRFPIGPEIAAGAAAIMQEMTAWPARMARLYRHAGAEALVGPRAVVGTTPGRPPGDLRMLGLPMARRALRGTGFGPNDEWNIGVLHRPLHTLLDEEASLNIRYLPAPAPGGRRSAPSGYIDALGRLNVLYRKTRPDGRSEIARARPKQDNVIKRSRTMLATPTDVGDPYAVHTRTGIMVVVGSPSSGRTDLYRVDDANEHLEFVRTLVPVPLRSPTLFPHAGRWWLMGALDPFPTASLHAWWSDSPEGDWRPHALGTLKVDPASARPGGTPFVHDGVLWRPAQDLAQPGHVHVVLNRVHHLDPHRFHEEPVREVRPRASSSHPHGIAMLFGMGGLTLVDGVRRDLPRIEKAPKPGARRRKPGRRP